MKKKAKTTLTFFMVISLFAACGAPLEPQTSISPSQEEKELNFRITWDSYSGRGEAYKRYYKSEPFRVKTVTNI